MFCDVVTVKEYIQDTLILILRNSITTYRGDRLILSFRLINQWHHFFVYYSQFNKFKNKNKKKSSQKKFVYKLLKLIGRIVSNVTFFFYYKFN